MQNIFWDKPVVADGRLVFGPQEAWRILTEQRVDPKDLSYVAAFDCILRALDGRGSPDEARELFEAALRSREVLIQTDYKLAG